MSSIDTVLEIQIAQFPEFQTEMKWWQIAYAKSLSRTLAYDGEWAGPITIGSRGGKSRLLRCDRYTSRVVISTTGTNTSQEVSAHGLLATSLVSIESIREAVDNTFERDAVERITTQLLRPHLARVQAEIDAMLLDPANLEVAERRRQEAFARSRKRSVETTVRRIQHLMHNLVEHDAVTEEDVVKWHKEAVISCVHDL